MEGPWNKCCDKPLGSPLPRGMPMGSSVFRPILCPSMPLHSPATPSLVTKGTAIYCKFHLELSNNFGALNCGLGHLGTFVLSTHCVSDFRAPATG